MDSVDDNADKAASRTLGQTLAAERERQGLSRSDAAQRLHMSAWQIEALETGDYGKLPKGTFLRGFVRNYAKVLAFPPGRSWACCPRTRRATGSPASSCPRRTSASTGSATGCRIPT